MVALKLMLPFEFKWTIDHRCSLSWVVKWRLSVFTSVTGSTLQRHVMQTLPALLSLCDGNVPVTGGSPSQMRVIRSFVVYLNKVLIKQFSYRWIETSRRSYDVAVICTYTLYHDIWIRLCIKPQQTTNKKAYSVNNYLVYIISQYIYMFDVRKWNIDSYLHHHGWYI